MLHEQKKRGVEVNKLQGTGRLQEMLGEKEALKAAGRWRSSLRKACRGHWRHNGERSPWCLVNYGVWCLVNYGV